MSCLFFGNFSFEESLAGNRQELPMGIRRLEAELAAAWLAVAGPGDWIWTPQPIEAGFPQLVETVGLRDIHTATHSSQFPAGLELVPWGFSEDARRFGAACHANIEAPSIHVVRLANSRKTSWQLEQQLGGGLDGAACVDRLPRLQELLSEFTADQPWVLKAEFGAAGRNRLRGRGPGLAKPQERWIQARLRRGESLFLEPWVESLAEVGSQWDVPREGAPSFLGLTRLLTDASGNYLGSEFGLDEFVDDTWPEAIEFAEQAALTLQERGYYGPLGIDAMRYRDESGEIRLRPLQDINARWTMGRLALGWRRITPSGIWRHGRLDIERISDQVIETSPRIVGDAPVRHQTWLEVPTGP